MNILIVRSAMMFVMGAGIYLADSQISDGQQAKPQPTPDDDVTIVYAGNPTDKEREYSKEYKRINNPDNTRRKLTELSQLGKARFPGKEVGTGGGISEVPDLGQFPKTGIEFLSKLSCQSDTIVIGSFDNKKAHLTEDDAWVYTEYDFVVSKILKNTQSGVISLVTPIELTRSGGLINLDGTPIRVNDSAYPPLDAHKQYLLFLRLIPSAGGFMPTDVTSEFAKDGDKFRSLSRYRIPLDLLGDLDAKQFLDQVSAAVSAQCIQELPIRN